MKNITVLLALIILCPCLALSQKTIIFQPGPDEGIDVKSRKLAPNTNYGDFRDITAHATDWLGPNVSRTFIKFDLTSLPVSTTVYDAKLTLYTADNLPNYPPGQSGDNGSIIQKVIENWDEHTLTHNDQPNTDSTGQIFLPPTVSHLQHYEDIDITHFIVDMVQNPDSNFGIMIRLQTEVPNRCLCWCSSDYEIDSMRPKLVLTVDTCALPETDFSFQQIGDTFYFTNLTNSADAYLWDFGDGTNSTLENPVHVYQDFGYYNVCLTATDNLCGDSTICHEVEYCEAPVARFTWGFTGDSVKFYDLSTNASSWLWDFGDGTYDTVQNPVHYYTSVGYYQVCLTASNACGSDIFCDTLDLNPAPLFSFLIKNGACHFYGDSLGIETWLWDFGDGNFSTEPSPVHVYDEYGTYEVCLTVTGSFGEETYCNSVYFCPVPTAAFDYYFNHDTVVFFNITTNANTWDWDFGDGFGSNLASPVYVFKENGEYIVCLTVENECGIDQACDTLIITGILETTFEENIVNIYPNPSRDFIIVDVINNISDVATLYIYSTTGNLLESLVITGDYKLNASRMPPGLYLMQIIAGTKTETRKFQVIE